MSAHVHERLSAFLDGEGTAAERATVDAHLRECAECAAVLQGFAAVDDLARRLPAEAPEGYFTDFSARVRRRLETPRRAWRVPVWTLAAAATLVLAVVTPMTWQRARVAREPEPPAAAAVPPATSLAPRPAVAPDDVQTPEQLEVLGYTAAEGDSRAGGADKPARAGEARAVRGREAERERPAGARAGEADRLAAVDEEVPPPAPPPPPQAAEGARVPSVSARPEPPKKEGFAAAPPPVPATVAAESPSFEAARDAEGGRPEPTGIAAATPAPAGAAERPAAVGVVGGLGKRDDVARRKPASRSAEEQKKASSPAEGEGRFRALLDRPAGTVSEARALREAWRAFAAAHPSGPQGDEARVRTIEAGLAAWRLGGDPADRARLTEDARAYLRRSDAAQPQRVQALVDAATR